MVSIEGGLRIAIKILSMRFHREKGETGTYSQKLISISHEVLLQYAYGEETNRNNHPDHRLAQIAGVSLCGEEGAQPAGKLCQLLVEGFHEYRVYSFNYPRLLGKLAQIQPYIFLDAFVGQDEYMFSQRGFDDLKRVDSPVNQISENVLIDWCERVPETRYPLIVSSMQMYSQSKDSEDLCWHPILHIVFEKSPNLQAVLSQLENEIYPMSWSGSRAEAMAKRFTLFAELFEHPNLEIRDWAKEQHQKLELAVQAQREHELKRNQERFERFE